MKSRGSFLRAECPSLLGESGGFPRKFCNLEVLKHHLILAHFRVKVWKKYRDLRAKYWEKRMKR